MRYFGHPPLRGLLACVAALFISTPTLAQTLDLSADQVVIGAKLQGHYSVPEGKDQPHFGIGLRRKGQETYYWKQSVPKAERGTMDLKSPADPGQFEAVLYDENREIYAVSAFSAIVTSTPNALQLDKNDYIAGEKIYVSVHKEQNRFYGNGWVGMFRQGSHGEGGASTADARITWQRLPPPDQPLVFTAPSNPGTYEFRLFDRDNWYYMLDRIAVTVAMTATPGAMVLDKETFVIGEPLTLSVQLETNRHYGNAFIGLYKTEREAPGGGKVNRSRLTYQRVNTKTQRLKFTTPTTPGLYEFRLYDRDATHYMLDSIPFEVIVPTTPGAISLPKDIFTIGEAIALQVQLEPGRHYGNAWIGLYRSGRVVPGGAKVERERLTYQRVKIETEQLLFTAPTAPGDYEFLLFDRDASHYGLDRLAFKTVVPPTPGVMSLVKDTFTIGEAIPLQVQLETGRHYGNAWIGLYRKRREGAGGGYVARKRHTYQRVSVKTEQLTYTAPDWPGTYEFRLYDRDAGHYLLDTLEFRIEVPPTPKALSLNKDSYVIGEAMHMTVRMESGRHYGNAWIGLYRLSGMTEGGAGIEYYRISYQRANVKTTGLSWTAPKDPGQYEFRLYDRDAGHFLIATVSFQVEARPQAGLLSVQKSTYRPGETVRVRIRMPENRYLSSPRAWLSRAGHTINGGAVVSEYSNKSFKINANEAVLSFKAPSQAGPWELRFHDRGRGGFILDIQTFMVAEDTPSGLERNPIRFTPMPGGPAAALRPNSAGGSFESGEQSETTAGSSDNPSDEAGSASTGGGGSGTAAPDSASGNLGNTDTSTESDGLALPKLSNPIGGGTDSGAEGTDTTTAKSEPGNSVSSSATGIGTENTESQSGTAGTGNTDTSAESDGLPLPKLSNLIGGGTGGADGKEPTAPDDKPGAENGGIGGTLDIGNLGTGGDIKIGGLKDNLITAEASDTGGQSDIAKKKEPKGLIGGLNQDKSEETEVEPLASEEPKIKPPQTALPATTPPTPVSPGIEPLITVPPGLAPPKTAELKITPPKTVAPGSKQPRTPRTGSNQPKTTASGTGPPRAAGSGATSTTPSGTGANPPKAAATEPEARQPQLAMADTKAPEPTPEKGRNDEPNGEQAAAQKDLEVVEEHLRTAIAAQKEELGADHPEVAFSLIDIAGVYRAQGRDKEAERALKSALSIRQNALGSDHLLVGAALNELSQLYKSLGRYKEAADTALRDIEIFEKYLGPDHLTLGGLLLRYAEILRKLGRNDEADEAEFRGHDIYARTPPGAPPPSGLEE